MSDLLLIRESKEIDELRYYLKDKEFITVDVETTGLTEEATIVGLSICAEAGKAYYIIQQEWDKQSEELISLDNKDSLLQLLVSLCDKKLIGHNFIFDAAMIQRNYGVNLIEACYCDTLVLAHLLDENRPKGLKELAKIFYGEEAILEQGQMKESVLANGGVWKDSKGGEKEMYKADSIILGTYGAKDALLTFSLFYDLIPELYGQELDKFFFEESMPLLRGPTFELNTIGLKVDVKKLDDLSKQLESELFELKSFILKEIEAEVKELYPATTKKNIFNINSNVQLSWLLFYKLGNVFGLLTDSGKRLCEILHMRIPYTNAAKKEFIEKVSAAKDYKPENFSKVKEWWCYVSADEANLAPFSKKYKWVEKLLEYKKISKLLNTYVGGIKEHTRYGVVRPSFLQTGTDGTRYSSRNPNFQNLPRKDKRIKECVIARPGKVFVGADYSQLEPRIFAYISGDEQLTASFQNGQDFYSVVGTKVFDKPKASLYKDDANFFGTLYPDLRDKTKIFTLAIVYGKSIRDVAKELDIKITDAQKIKDNYFKQFPKIELMMLAAYENVKRTGCAKNIFGRVRRLPEALNINKIYPNVEHKDLQYKERTLLNLGCNYPIQATAGSIVNRAAIAFNKAMKKNKISAPLVLQVHDSLVVECELENAEFVSDWLSITMQTATKLENVPLEATPKIGNNLAEV